MAIKMKKRDLAVAILIIAALLGGVTTGLTGCSIELKDLNISTPETGISVGGSVPGPAAPSVPQLPMAAILTPGESGYDAAWPGKQFVITWGKSPDMPEDALTKVLDEWKAFTASFDPEDTQPHFEDGATFNLTKTGGVWTLPAATSSNKIVLRRYWPATLPDDTTSADFSDKWNNGDSLIGLEARKDAFDAVEDAIEAMCDNPEWDTLYSGNDTLADLKQEMTGFIPRGSETPGVFQGTGLGSSAPPNYTTGKGGLFELYFGYVPKATDTTALGGNDLDDLVFGP